MIMRAELRNSGLGPLIINGSILRGHGSEDLF
jgi:hypothetical protein